MSNKLPSPIILTFLTVLVLVMTNCAKRGNPEGGPRDTIPPVVVRAVPENFTTNFDAKEIRIYFDEYVRLNNVQGQLIVSPPFKNEPNITPLGAAKYVKIKINDTLRENTTYAINFGQSIVDNNENNPYQYYKYVFSTGSFIDSLSLGGTVRDALLAEPEEGITVMLYEYGENFNDSIVFLEKPYYITNVQDSTYNYELTNLKEGQYILTALKDKNNNYKFDPFEDKIAFIDGPISLPTDSVYELSLFKETLDYDLKRPVQVSKRQILFGYDGIADSLKINLVQPRPEGFEKKIIKERDKDSLRYWFRPEIKSDTIEFLATNQSIVDTLIVRWRDFAADSLQIKKVKTGTLNFEESMIIGANIPIVSVDTSLVKINNKDSMQIPFSVRIDTVYNEVSFPFDLEESQSYNMEILPGAITDFYGNVNDTLTFRSRTLAKSDYGTLTMDIQNVKQYPIIVEITDLKGEVVESIVQKAAGEVVFDNLSPASYYVRIIYDQNDNGIWDTGSFLFKLKPEPVIYFGELIEANANWFLTQTFILQD